jgi:uncharacterized protein YaiI (UPF0178 family)
MSKSFRGFIFFAMTLIFPILPVGAAVDAHVVSHTPEAGEYLDFTEPDITVTFDGTLAQDTVSAGNITLSRNGSRVNADISLSPKGTAVNIVPAGAILAGEEYILEFSGSVETESGGVIDAASRQLTFTTASYENLSDTFDDFGIGKNNLINITNIPYDGAASGYESSPYMIAKESAVYGGDGSQFYPFKSKETVLTYCFPGGLRSFSAETAIWDSLNADPNWSYTLTFESSTDNSLWEPRDYTALPRSPNPYSSRSAYYYKIGGFPEGTKYLRVICREKDGRSTTNTLVTPMLVNLNFTAGFGDETIIPTITSSDTDGASLGLNFNLPVCSAELSAADFYFHETSVTVTGITPSNGSKTLTLDLSGELGGDYILMAPALTDVFGRRISELCERPSALTSYMPAPDSPLSFIAPDISVSFDIPLAENTVNEETVTLSRNGKAVNSTVSLSARNRTVHIKTAGAILAGETYILDFSKDIQNVTGERISGASRQLVFTTASYENLSDTFDDFGIGKNNLISITNIPYDGAASGYESSPYMIAKEPAVYGGDGSQFYPFKNKETVLTYHFPGGLYSFSAETAIWDSLNADPNWSYTLTFESSTDNSLWEPRDYTALPCSPNPYTSRSAYFYKIGGFPEGTKYLRVICREKDGRSAANTLVTPMLVNLNFNGLADPAVTPALISAIPDGEALELKFSLPICAAELRPSDFTITGADVTVTGITPSDNSRTLTLDLSASLEGAGYELYSFPAVADVFGRQIPEIPPAPGTVRFNSGGFYDESGELVDISLISEGGTFTAKAALNNDGGPVFEELSLIAALYEGCTLLEVVVTPFSQEVPNGCLTVEIGEISLPSRSGLRAEIFVWRSLGSLTPVEKAHSELPALE